MNIFAMFVYFFLDIISIRFICILLNFTPRWIWKKKLIRTDTLAKNKENENEKVERKENKLPTFTVSMNSRSCGNERERDRKERNVSLQSITYSIHLIISTLLHEKWIWGYIPNKILKSAFPTHSRVLLFFVFWFYFLRRFLLFILCFLIPVVVVVVLLSIYTKNIYL